MSRSIRVSLPLLAVFLLLFVPVAGFAQDTTSSIKGNVYDSSGAAVANADIRVRDTRTGVVRNYSSNEKGAFLATRLPVGGPYEVTVNNTKKVTVESITLGDVFNLAINITTELTMEEVIVTGQGAELIDVAAGPSAVYTQVDMEQAVSFNRDIIDVYGLDPRVNVDNDDRGFEINCGGKHPRFNSVTLDGVSMNDRFGLNTNGYSTAVGMPFPYDAIEQVAVELAPFDVSYGGFSACNINAVTKAGTNEFHGGVFYDYTSDDLRGDSLGDNLAGDFSAAPFSEERQGFHIGGPIIKDKLFFFAAYFDTERPQFLAMGPAGSGHGVERPWLRQADFDRIDSIARNVYNYDTGGMPGDPGVVEEKYMVRIDWNINEFHNLAFVYNNFEGSQGRASDNDPDEYEFANHFYVKGAESPTYTAKLASSWTDAFSTEIFYSDNEMIDAQVTVGPKFFADSQIEIGGGDGTVYLGADDSRQANSLATRSKFFKIAGNWLVGDHVITAGYEQEELNIFNIFVQHSRSGEYDYFDDSDDNPAHCAALSAQGRFEDPDCGMSGIDKFELGRPNTIYYGSAGGSNNALDAAADFTNTQHSVYIQDDVYFPGKDLSIVFGIRYDWFSSSDSPNFNQAFTDANNGLRNDASIDGLDSLLPRFGFTWGVNDTLSLRGGVGLFSGGNPNVWLSNAWSNDGVTNVQPRLSNSSGALSVLDGSIPLTGSGQPNVDVPQALFDEVAAAGPENGSTRRIVILDPNYEQPEEWKFALGGTWDMPWGEWQMDFDYLHTKAVDPAMYVDLSQTVVGMTATGHTC
jgi:outer membrane receptor protein involved in Fe transport